MSCHNTYRSIARVLLDCSHSAWEKEAKLYHNFRRTTPYLDWTGSVKTLTVQLIDNYLLLAICRPNFGHIVVIKHTLSVSGCDFCCFYFLVGVKVILLRPELWLNRLQQLCRTCNPRPTKLWQTAGLQRQLCTWKERLSRRNAGLTIPP